MGAPHLWLVWAGRGGAPGQPRCEGEGEKEGGREGGGDEPAGRREHSSHRVGEPAGASIADSGCGGGGVWDRIWKGGAYGSEV